jgi:hypothetical protein
MSVYYGNFPVRRECKGFSRVYQGVLWDLRDPPELAALLMTCIGPEA